MVVVDDSVRRRAVEAIGVVAREVPIRAAFLFGSHVDGNVDGFSDIDVAAFVEGSGDLDLERRVRLAVETQRQVGDDVEIHFLAADYLDDPPTASFASYVRENGLRLDIPTILPENIDRESRERAPL